MYFSYYFDIKKTHLLNCGFVAETFGTQADGTITTKFTAYIEEIIDGQRVKREQKTQEFTFPAAQRVNDPSDYDIDFLRERYAPQKKWIFVVKNNRNPLQKIQIGLISETANQNPLGMDIFYEDEKYKSELKASNLSKLESNYVAPVIQQTLVNFDFTSPGFPEGFTAVGATYDSSYKLYEASDFTHILSEAVQANTKFTLSLNMAPNSINPASPPEVFKFRVLGVGTFSLLQNGISYLGEGQEENNRVTRTFNNTDLPLAPIFFFNYGLKDKSKLTIEADGKGNITFTYGGIAITGSYDASKKVTGFSLEGVSDAQTSQKIKVKLDNISLIYEK